MDLIFENPPAPQRGVGAGAEYEKVAETLRLRPNEWARVADYTDVVSTTPAKAAATAANNIKKSRAMREGFEIISRSGKVYARYVAAQ